MPSLHRIGCKMKAFFASFGGVREPPLARENSVTTGYGEGANVAGMIPLSKAIRPSPPSPRLETKAAALPIRVDDRSNIAATSSLLALQTQSPAFSATAAHSGTPNYFRNASGFVIEQQTITNVQSLGLSKTVFEYLQPYISHGAAHDSSERSDAPKCDPETRRAVQEDIVSWMTDGDKDEDPKQIMWLGGPAGAGKTAIAGSVAETCRKEGHLAATFFFSSFSGSADRHSKRFLISTLAHHLAKHSALHEYKVQLLHSFERHPDILHKRLMEQAECLLLQPFRMIQEQGEGSSWPKGIVIDGLDEVLADRQRGLAKKDVEPLHEEDQLEILDVLIALANDPAFPFRIFVASRPERVINEFFSTTAKGATLSIFLDSKYQPDADIERFLWSKLATIRRRYDISDASWPGQDAVNHIVDMSSGQFIVPATIIRHIGAGVPQRQLDDIMQLKWEDSGRKNPFAAIDALYTCIMHRSPEPRRAVKWIRAGTNLLTWIQSAHYLKQLVEDDEGEFSHVLGPLSSLVSIPSSTDHQSSLRIYHKSLGDFFSSKRRSADLFLDDSDMYSFVAARCAGVLKLKGPAVTIRHSPNELRSYLASFYISITCLGRVMSVVRRPEGSLLCGDLHLFLHNLDEKARADIALCDVAWWTGVCLDGARDGSGDTFNPLFLGGMYCGIHRYMCDSTSPPTNCYASCCHWRAGILAEAKALNWCVHELEQVDVEELSEIAFDDWDRLFKPMGRQLNGSHLSCNVCQPGLPPSAS